MTGTESRPSLSEDHDLSVLHSDRRYFLRSGLLFTGGVALVFGGCARNRWTYRYRLTFDVDTPEGVKTGTGVYEVRSGTGFSVLGSGSSGQTFGAAVKGEAIPIDLGPRGTLFVIMALRNENQTYPDRPRNPTTVGAVTALPTLVFLRTGAYDKKSSVSQRELSLETLVAKADLVPDEIPFMVRFRNINDPNTVERVEPGDLAKTFGAGVRLKKATLEMTKDPVTGGIESKLPWLAAFSKSGAHLDGQRGGGGISSRCTVSE